MPEFYEVKRIKNYLMNSDIINDRIIGFNFKNNGARILKTSTGSDFKCFLLDNQIHSIITKAKYTLFEMEKGSILIHYRFTGIPHVKDLPYDDKLYSIYSLPIINLKEDYIRFSIKFKNNRILNFYDTRCLSHLHFHHSSSSFNDYASLNNVAEDIDHYTPDTFLSFKDNYQKSTLDLKMFLLDQSKPPSGIGNYLANEILAYANLNPWLKISDISNHDYLQLIDSINLIKNFCESSSRYDWFKVFNRNSCASCNYNVMKRRHRKGAQSTFYCPQCQLAD